MRVAQYHFGDLAFGLVEVVEAVLDLFQQVVHAVHLGSWEGACNRWPIVSGVSHRNLGYR
ncbi:hypothetical protein D3C81_1953340 [compost metagenome]